MGVFTRRLVNAQPAAASAGPLIAQVGFVEDLEVDDGALLVREIGVKMKYKLEKKKTKNENCDR